MITSGDHERESHPRSSICLLSYATAVISCFCVFNVSFAFCNKEQKVFVDEKTVNHSQHCICRGKTEKAGQISVVSEPMYNSP